MAIVDVDTGQECSNSQGIAKPAGAGALSLRGVELGPLDEIKLLIENWQTIKKVANLSELTIKFGYGGCYQVTLK